MIIFKKNRDNFFKTYRIDIDERGAPCDPIGSRYLVMKAREEQQVALEGKNPLDQRKNVDADRMKELSKPSITQKLN